jgi:hypothetical protein
MATPVLIVIGQAGMIPSEPGDMLGASACGDPLQ